jgi:hypothetical protein
MVDQQEYECECCRFYKDGLLCVHILKVFTHLGVDVIPSRYILARWTQNAIPAGAAPAADSVPDVMSPEALQMIRHANLCTDFAKVAKVACRSDEGAAICNAHIRAMRTEVGQMDKVLRKRKKKQANPTPSAATQASVGEPGAGPSRVMNPLKTSTKGRKKSKALGSALELQPKRAVRCGVCGELGHNSATCIMRLNQSV